jgi:hypothetical protein
MLCKEGSTLQGIGRICWDDGFNSGNFQINQSNSALSYSNFNKLEVKLGISNPDQVSLWLTS